MHSCQSVLFWGFWDQGSCGYSCAMWRKRKEQEKGGKPTLCGCLESQIIYCPRLATGWNFSLAERGNSNRRSSCPHAAVPERLPPHTIPSPLLFYSSPLSHMGRWSIGRTDPNKTCSKCWAVASASFLLTLYNCPIETCYCQINLLLCKTATLQNIFVPWVLSSTIILALQVILTYYFKFWQVVTNISWNCLTSFDELK